MLKRKLRFTQIPVRKRLEMALIALATGIVLAGCGAEPAKVQAPQADPNLDNQRKDIMMKGASAPGVGSNQFSGGSKPVMPPR